MTQLRVASWAHHCSGVQQRNAIPCQEVPRTMHTPSTAFGGQDRTELRNDINDKVKKDNLYVTRNC